MKNIEEFLLDLSCLDIKLWVEEGRLRCNAPKGTLTPEIRTHLSERKAEIISFLQQINLNSNSSFESISPVPRNQELPLSFAQQRLWFLYQLEGGNSTYNLPLTLEITGNLNIAALEQAIREILRRHEILRTHIVIVNDNPMQVIDPEIDFNLELIDLEDLPSASKFTTVKQLATKEGDKPFDLINSPLVRFHLWRLSEQSHVLVINMHHIVSDGWSMGIFMQELSAFYQAFTYGNATNISTVLPELSIQYADFAVWQQQYLQGEILEKQLNYWKQQLADAPPLLELPTDRPRPPVQSFRGGVVEFQLDSDLSAKLKILSQKSGATLFMTMLAAFVTLLERYSGQDDICIGSPVANRNRKEIESLLGFFVNTLVLRFQLGENPSFSDLLNQVKKVAADGQTHQDVPFEQVVEALQPERNLSYSPLFQVLFDLQYDSRSQLEFPGLTVTPLQTEIVTSKFDLSLVIEDTINGLRGWWEYSSDLFNVDTITRMTGHFQTLLAAIVENPQTPISILPILTQKEQHQLLVEWNSTKSDFAEDKCIHELFELQVKRNPETIALEFGCETLTYAQLNNRANQLADYLITLGVKPDVLVGLCVERSVEMIVGLLGILKAGGAYLPLDPNYPPERLAHMVDDSGVLVLLTQQKLINLINLLPESKAKVVCFDSDLIFTDGIYPVCTKVKPNNLAYIIYTSGSTGKPKGVMISHSCVVNHATSAIAEYGLTNCDRVLQFASFSFDVAAEEIFPTLLSGGTLVMRPREMFSSFADFSRFIEQKSLTVVNIPTPYWQEWVLEISQGKSVVPNNLRLLVTGSEQVIPERLALWQQLVGDRVMWVNAYGPTEATITATVYKPQSSSKHNYTNGVSIGRPIANTQIYILDKNLQPVPIGVPGELHIGGVGLASGYLNLPELTKQKFIPIPYSLLPTLCSRLYKTGDKARYLPDGNIEFLGRIDNQVKIRGFRIELGEIEALLAQHPLVRASAVIVREDQPGNKQIIAYIVPNHQPSIQNQLRDFLKQKLPDYMVPSIFVMLEELPLTPNGKVNRRALPKASISQSDNFVNPRTDTEKTVAKIWSNILGVKQISIHDNFFELGGHSLRATQVISQLRETWKIDLPLRYLFEEPTTAGLAELIDKIIAQDNSAKITTNTEEDFRKDAVLDPNIRPQKLSFDGKSQPQNILLTGATGFVGAYLIHELLEKTEANIYCLIRSQNLEQARQKLQNKLKIYGIWETNKNTRIIPIVGDLSKKLLGLSPSQFHDLANKIDIIYHNAAWINTIYPYSVLKPSNVLGTQEILRLASEIKLKPVHYISTTSVFSAIAYSQNNCILESDPLDKTEGLENGYCQSKWVAEKLVMEARDRGLPVSIYRLARVTGHSQTGICNTDDLFCRLIKGCIQMGIAPQMDDALDNLTPVDYVSKAIVHLSQQKESLGKAFHLLNPHPTPMNELFNLIPTLGYPLQQVPYQQWLEQLVKESQLDSDNVLKPLLPVYSQNTTDSTPEPEFDLTNTHQGLVGTDIIFPSMELQLLETYFSYFIKSGYLTAPLSTNQLTALCR
ncbi:amino acid adenylation domain-containing protein [Plectonema cf. radiosum LEGE 06105]|uniref:Amino acid adenylation domain-containing protein n=1 Tax=Plectonema cf. radiosum LEGE 06105 TaxID=945769 RepID=A0A8J7EZ89_9CYAN|nr:non-ribosomal peptide synthetase [Plectonema radiosum]MBE9211188.1 amino acid adenylation domain-containing protein [Plectonema cf. radiosum LEGE 06105]